MPNKSLSGNAAQIQNLSDQCVPEGAQIIQISQAAFDGTGTITYTFNTDSINFKKPSTVRTLYFDARNLSADALVAVQGGPTLRIPTGKQGYIPLFMPCPFTITITSATGNGALNLALHNFKVYPYQW